MIALVDLPFFGRRTRLVWHKHHFSRPDGQCPRASWTEEDHRIGAPRTAMTDRAGRWVAAQVGRSARCSPDATQVAADPFHVESSPTPISGSAAGARRTRRWATAAARPTRSVVAAVLLTMADERFQEDGRRKLLGLFRTGDPKRRGDDRLAREGGTARALYPHRPPDRGPLPRSNATAVNTRPPPGTTPTGATDGPTRPAI